MSWDKAIDFTLLWEGGYVNNPKDRGGETNRGITKLVLGLSYKKGIVSHNDIKRLTKEDAIAIYKARYWNPYGWERLEEPVDMILFDMTVNHGIGGAAKIAQRACVSLGTNVVIDGSYGPQTKNTLVALSKTKNLDLAQMLLIKRINFYDKIVEARPSLKVFLKGWLRRTQALAKEVGVKI